MSQCLTCNSLRAGTVDNNFTFLDNSGNSNPVTQPPTHPPTPANMSAVTSECTALLGRRSVSEGFQTVASACVLRQPTSCGSEYFYNQRPQVWNLIGTECSLNRGERRVKREAS